MSAYFLPEVNKSDVIYNIFLAYDLPDLNFYHEYQAITKMAH
jgi:hypothetical protein